MYRQSRQFGDDFNAVDTWVFDLDNTLYPAHCNLFVQVDRRMGEFIAGALDLSLPDAKKLQKEYYRDYGTTMNGLMVQHGLDPEPFLAYVHDIDTTCVKPDPALSRALVKLPGRNYVHTNGSLKHSANILARLGIADCFSEVFDIAAANYVPKPKLETYTALMSKISAQPGRTTMFEDLARNLEVPYTLGMTTVLITSANHPDGTGAAQEGKLEHVHHVTDDLAGFLDQIVG